ncbi:hypothetical protein MATL_G00046260 [Megalops atlanticus]|uniref:DNA helicase n=1 Tax=Megalops atlanticus TaxID=7932 RepID=A0A9D3Q9N4_MEGAT|nr:hypothetical protein MATL_G00046260 [Megalops atlanticus]
MTEDICGTSKLTMLVTKLHEYLALSFEEDSRLPAIPESSHGTAGQNVESHTVDQIIKEPGISVETVKPTSSRSKRKPSIVTKHTGLDESGASCASGDEDVISNNGSDSDLDMKRLPKGTVVVRPEPVGNEAKDDFRGPEFRCRGATKLRNDFPRKRGGDHLKIVSCTACGQQVNHFQKDSFYQHPVLKVLICKGCFKYYMSDDISKDVDGMDEQCRWCAEGGNLICCDFCSNAFCKKCILRNLGRKELSGIMDEESKWYCYVCSPEPLFDLVVACDSVLQNLEHQRRTKGESEKPGQDDSAIKHLQKDKTTFNEKDHTSDSLDCGAVVFTYKALKVPRELAKKAKKLVETTTALNNTFVKFIQQGSEDQGTHAVRLRHLKAFRSVLADLRTAHAALEEALEQEFKDTVQLNGEDECDFSELSPQEQDAEATVNETAGNHVENQSSVDNVMENAADGRNVVEECTVPDDAEVEENPVLSHNVQELTCGITDFQHSVPEEILEIEDSVTDSAGVTETIGCHPAGARKSSRQPVSNSKSADVRKSPIKVTKKLVVKLTPMPLDESLGYCLQRKRGEEESKDGEEEKEEREEDTAVVFVGDSEESLQLEEDQENRRSPRVKTTPLRRQADSKSKLACLHNSDTDHDDTDLDIEAETRTPQNVENLELKGEKCAGRSMASSSRVEDSDSDEVPAILLQTAALMPGSGESESTGEESCQNVKKKCLFWLKKSASQSREKMGIKWRMTDRPSDTDDKVLVRKAAKKRRNGSYSSSDDSDLEKDKNLSKLRKSGPHMSKKLKCDEDQQEWEGKKGKKKGTVVKRKSIAEPRSRLHNERRTVEQFSSSFSEEDSQYGDSGGDSDDQKIKPITEDMAVLGASAFQQSLGEESEIKPGSTPADDDDDDPENS